MSVTVRRHSGPGPGGVPAAASVAAAARPAEVPPGPALWLTPLLAGTVPLAAA